MRILWVALLLLGSVVHADVQEDQAKADAYYQAEDFKKAFKKYKSLAKAGDSFSQFRLSSMYLDGLGTKVNENDAYGWSVLAAEAGDEKAISYSTDLLDTIEDKSKAQATANKLMDKYGREALAEKTLRLASRKTKCTGSRLRCGSQTLVSGHDYRTDAGAPIQSDGAN